MKVPITQGTQVMKEEKYYERSVSGSTLELSKDQNVHNH